MLAAASLGGNATGPGAEVEVVDAGDSPETAVAAAQKAMDGGAKMLLGPLFSGQSRAVAEAVGRGTPVVSLSNDSSIAGDNLFVFGITPQQSAKSILGFAATRGKRNVVTVVPPGPFGALSAQAAQSVVAATGLAAISGSGSADVAAISAIMQPELRRRKYDVDFSAAVIACAGSLAQIIPPSLMMVVVALVSNLSVGAMFLAGVLPGLLTVPGILATAYIHARRGGPQYREVEPFSLARVIRTFWAGLPALGMPVIIIGGIIGGALAPIVATWLIAAQGVALVGLYMTAAAAISLAGLWWTSRAT